MHGSTWDERNDSAALAELDRYGDDRAGLVHWGQNPEFLENKRIHESELERPERRTAAQARMIAIQNDFYEGITK